jgi:hypothetical protein
MLSPLVNSRSKKGTRMGKDVEQAWRAKDYLAPTVKEMRRQREARTYVLMSYTPRAEDAARVLSFQFPEPVDIVHVSGDPEIAHEGATICTRGAFSIRVRFTSETKPAKKAKPVACAQCRFKNCVCDVKRKG